MCRDGAAGGRRFRAGAYFFGMLIVLLFCSFSEARIVSAQNLIANPDFETADPSNPSSPQGWIRGRWGTNSTVFTYPAEGVDGGRAASVSISSRTSGDAKWAFSPIAVTPGKTYAFSDYYRATVPTFITLEYRRSDGSTFYVDIAEPPARNAFGQVSVRFTPPEGTASVTVFHLLNRVGTLTVDRYDLHEVEETPPPPPAPNNLVPNPSFESTDAAGQPAPWGRGRWGTNTAAFSFPVSGYEGSKAARVEISAYTSGDAKWHFPETQTAAGRTYSFSDAYRSNETTRVTVQWRLQDGSRTYTDLPNAPASLSWRTYSASFTAPQGAVALTVFHVLRSVGYLETDAFSLVQTGNQSDPVLFDTGLVAIHFDDGWLSSYENALPILDAAGFKSTHFITTEYLGPTFPGYVKPSHVRDMEARGHEIGAHTRTHPDLTSLSISQARSEIAGSREDLLGFGLNTIDFFAYPFGAYNQQIIALVQEAGFRAARSSDGGYNLKTEDIWTLNRQPMTNTTTFTQVKGYIDKAMADRSLVILLFHEVDTNTHTYNVTPALFQQIVNYMKTKGIEPVTMQEIYDLMSQ